MPTEYSIYFNFGAKPYLRTTQISSRVSISYLLSENDLIEESKAVIDFLERKIG